MTVDSIPRGEPREIATRNVFKVLIDEIISRGESPDSRPGCSVVRGKAIQALAGLLVAVALIFSAQRQVLAHHSTSVSGPKVAKRRAVRIAIPDFSLTDQSASIFRFAQLRGKVILLSFVYTTCPDLCPLVTTSMRSVQKNLNSNERNAVFFLSITTDPEIDKPQVLKSYGERYGVDFSNWSFLTGEIRELRPVWKSFGVEVHREARGLVNHTLLTGLVDGKGVRRFVYHGAAPRRKIILQDLRSLLLSR